MNKRKYKNRRYKKRKLRGKGLLGRDHWSRPPLYLPKYKQKGGVYSGFSSAIFSQTTKQSVKMRRKENYPMRKLDVPKRVTLPNGRTFVARCERIKRRELPADIQMKRTYKQRAAPRNKRSRRPAQQGQGIISVVKKVIKNPAFRAIAKKGLEYASGLYQNITKRIKNKKVKRFLNSDLAILGLGQAIKAGNRLLDVKPAKPKIVPKPKLV